jgi:lysophospholipase L1-like esterase
MSNSGFVIALTLGLTAAIRTLNPAGAQTIVAVGPSSTYGAGVNRNEAYPAQLEGMLRSKGLKVTVVNAGINGEQTPQMLARLNSVVPDGTRLVILNFTPFNDRPISRAGRWNPIPPEQSEQNFNAMAKMMRDRRIPYVVLSREGGGRGGAHVPYGRFDPATDILPDGIHTTPRGHEKIALRLLPVVERMLRSGR